MANWRAVGKGFIVELFLGVIGLLVPVIGQLIAGLVGGFVAGYSGSTTVRSGLWHGLLAGSLGGFMLAVPVGILVAVASVGIGLLDQFGGLIAGVSATMLVVLIATILGANSALGGAIGGLVKGRHATPLTSHSDTLARNESRPSMTGEGESKQVVSNPSHEESASSPKLTDVVKDRR